MTDTAPAPPAPPDGLEFVHNGIIRFHFAEDKVVRVRRPFLGELKKIRLALENLQDELAPLIERVTVTGRRLQQEATELSDLLGKEEISVEEHAERLADIKRQDRDQAREMDSTREELILGWWGDVFRTLALDPVPEDPMLYPAWILSPLLPNRCLTHWRSIPAGPG